MTAGVAGLTGCGEDGNATRPFLDHECRVTTQFSPKNDRQITTAALHSLSFTLRTRCLVQ